MNSSSKSPFSLWAPVLVYMALIFLISSASFRFLFFQKAQKIHADWLAHIVEYSVLGFLLARALANSTPKNAGAAWLWTGALVVGALYGVTDEFHQSFVPTRDASVYDVIADGVGTGVGAWIWIRKYGKKNA